MFYPEPIPSKTTEARFDAKEKRFLNYYSMPGVNYPTQRQKGGRDFF